MTVKIKKCCMNTISSHNSYMCSNGSITSQQKSNYFLVYYYACSARKELVEKKSVKSAVHINIYRQISETFMNVLQFHENHNRILREGERGHVEIIDCIVQLGRRIGMLYSFYHIGYR